MRIRHTRADGFEIEGWPVRIDAGRRQQVGLVTHAHTDHAARHEHIICTPETALLLGARWKRLTARAVPLGQSVSLEGARVTLLPAGHILGSAMVQVEMGERRILFTGDFRTEASALLEGAGPVNCDVLVMESTFGRREYRFPDAGRVRQLISGFVDAARASSYTPVLTGYSLGKAQELVALLGSYHETVWVHPRIAEFCALYRQAGVKLPDVQVPGAGAPPGSLVVMPPDFQRTEWREQIVRPRVCFCSGWALGGPGGHYAADQMIPLSDHADCASLVAFATATGASRVYTMHGFAAELAELLRQEGMDASPLPRHWQDVRASDDVRYTAETLDLFDAP
jgi:putative mRNA 3-end processing factor